MRKSYFPLTLLAVLLASPCATFAQRSAAHRVRSAERSWPERSAPQTSSVEADAATASFAAPQTAPASAAAPGDDGKEIELTPVLLSYKEVKDNFGRRIADTYAVVQVTVKNPDLAHQFILQELTAVLDPNQCLVAQEFYRDFDARACTGLYDRYFKYPIRYAPVERPSLLAVATIGQTKNPRNVAFRLLRSLGSVGSALTGFDFIGRDGKAGIGIFNGAFLESTDKLFPDLTIGQMTRLTEQSYQPNTLVESRETKAFDIFLPTDQLFSKESWKMYKQGPRQASKEALEMRQLLQLVLTVRAKGLHIESAEEGGGDDATGGGAPSEPLE